MKTTSETHKLKVYTIKKLREMRKLIVENHTKKEWLTVSEVIKEFSISRKSLDRMREKGLEISQPKRNGKILVNRIELEAFLNAKL